MKKRDAVVAALLALACGLVILNVGAQQRRAADSGPVRASVTIHHTIREGEYLTSDDGLEGPGGIMQHYFGRLRTGDIARLRAYNGNVRVIRVAQCTWPEEVPLEDRTPLQECPSAYAKYSIRRAVGRTIEIPVRWIPSRRLAELPASAPGIARDMRRIAAAMALSGSALPEEDSGTEGDDPAAPAPAVPANASVIPAPPSAVPDPKGGADDVRRSKIIAAPIVLVGVGGWGLSLLLALAIVCLLFLLPRRTRKQLRERMKKLDAERDAANAGNQVALVELNRMRTVLTEKEAVIERLTKDGGDAHDTILKIGAALLVPQPDPARILTRAERIGSWMGDLVKALKLPLGAFEKVVEEACARFDALRAVEVAVPHGGPTPEERRITLIKEVGTLAVFRTRFAAEHRTLTLQNRRMQQRLLAYASGAERTAGETRLLARSAQQSRETRLLRTMLREMREELASLNRATAEEITRLGAVSREKEERIQALASRIEDLEAANRDLMMRIRASSRPAQEAADGEMPGEKTVITQGRQEQQRAPVSDRAPTPRVMICGCGESVLGDDWEAHKRGCAKSAEAVPARGSQVPGQKPPGTVHVMGARRTPRAGRRHGTSR